MLAGDLNVSTFPLVEAFRGVPVGGGVALVNEKGVHFISESAASP